MRLNGKGASSKQDHSSSLDNRLDSLSFSWSSCWRFVVVLPLWACWFLPLSFFSSAPLWFLSLCPSPDIWNASTSSSLPNIECLQRQQLLLKGVCDKAQGQKEGRKGRGSSEGEGAGVAELQPRQGEEEESRRRRMVRRVKWGSLFPKGDGGGRHR